MFKLRKKQILELKKKLLEKESELKKALSYALSYNEEKLSDDFNTLNHIIDLKVSYYENVVFYYKRYKEDKKVNVETEELEKVVKDIIYETFQSISESYTGYLVTKYFASKDAMFEIYIQEVYLRLFAFTSKYNTDMIKDQIKDQFKTS